MDDIRRPQQPQRRDYGLPPARPVSPLPHRPPGPQPPRHAPAPQHQPQPSHMPQHQYHHQPAPVHHTPAHHTAPAARHDHPKTSVKSGKRLTAAAAAVILAAAAIFGAGYLLKGSSDQNTIPASITRQVNYNLYFPSPMPAGYIYMKDTATFQIGQVFYKFANGKKKVTVNEQPLTQNKPDLSLLAGYTLFDSPVGKAAVGTNLGEPTAVVVTDTTVITMNSIGGVSRQDLTSAINNLKNIGQRNQKT